MKLSTIPAEIPAEDPVVAAINDHNAEFAEFAYAAIKALNKSHQAFWSGTTQQIVDRFNALGVAQVVAAGNNHNPTANELNSIMDRAVSNRPDLASRFPERAITTPAVVIDWGAPLAEGAVPVIRLVDHVFVEGQLVDGVFEVVPVEIEPEE
jgi:hypothetical protein